MRINLIGAGRLATNLGMALMGAGHKIETVYSRTLASADALAQRLGAVATTDLAEVCSEADVSIISVSDAALADVVAGVTKGRRQQTFLHTAGSMPMAVFEDHAEKYGVLYPMQTFSKERIVDFSEIPVFIEASDNAVMTSVELLASSISGNVRRLSTADRKYLHLAAVFACNFANHCYALAEQILAEHGLPFDVMLPLTDETARKVHVLSPRKAQTGPAVRYDENVIDMQARLLEEHPEMRDIYLQMSQSIHKLSK